MVRFPRAPERSAAGASACLRVAAVAAIALLASSPAAAQLDLFTWTPQVEGSLPGASWSVTADAMHLVGADSPKFCFGGSSVALVTTAPADGTILVRASFESDDVLVDFDWGFFVVDGVETKIASWCDDCLVGFDVEAGQSFGFGVASQDCFGGAGTLDLTEFHFMPPSGGVDLPGAQPGGNLGAALAALTDLDGDGVRDLAAGAPRFDDATPDVGRVLLLSGADLAVLAERRGLFAGERLGSAIAAAGDLDGDGVPDVLAGAPDSDAAHPGAGRVEALSGADAAPLWSVPGGAAGDRFGYAVAAVGDCDHDGVADVAVGAPLADVAGADAGTVSVLSGADGAAIHQFHGPSPDARLGFALAPVEDLDGDGVADLLVGAPGADGGAPGSGVVWVVSARDGTVRLVLQGDATGDGFGRAVASAGDVDGDGRSDVLAGAPGADALGPDAGLARLHAGADGAPLLTVLGHGDGDQAGVAVAGAGDVDGDGVLDVLVGASQGHGPTPQAGMARIHSGRDGSLLAVLLGPAPGALYGAAVVGIGQALDGDAPDVAVGSPGHAAPGPGAGRAVVASVRVVWADLGSGLAGAGGASPRLAGKGLLVPSSVLIVALSDALPGAPCVFVAGAATLDAPFKGGVLVPAPQLLMPRMVGPGGGVSLPATWPAGVPAGAALVMQVWVQDPAGPAGWSASNAVRGTVP